MNGSIKVPEKIRAAGQAGWVWAIPCAFGNSEPVDSPLFNLSLHTPSQPGKCR